MPRTAMEDALERARAREAPEELEETAPPPTRRSTRPRPMLSEGRPRDPLVPTLPGLEVRYPGQPSGASAVPASMLSGAAVAAGVVVVLIVAGLLLRPVAPAQEAPTAAVWSAPAPTLEPIQVQPTRPPAATATAAPSPTVAAQVVQCVALPQGGADCTGQVVTP